MVNTIRKNFVHIAFTDEEKEEISKYAKEFKMSISEFCRQAIFDKIRMKENPELFQTRELNGYSKNQLSQLLELALDNKEKINELIDKYGTFVKIQDTLKTLSTIISRPELKEKELVVIELLRDHIELKPKEIMDLTGFSREEVYDIISNEKIFSINIKNGKVILNE